MTKLSMFAAAVLCMFGLFAWLHVAPAAGAGLILAFTILGTLSILGEFKSAGQNAFFATTITVGAGSIWWTHQTVPHNGWVLFLAIVAAWSAINALSDDSGKGGWSIRISVTDAATRKRSKKTVTKPAAETMPKARPLQ